MEKPTGGRFTSSVSLTSSFQEDILSLSFEWGRYSHHGFMDLATKEKPFHRYLLVVSCAVINMVVAYMVVDLQKLMSVL